MAKYILQLQHEPIRVGVFYLTIKVHKSPPTARPIVNTRHTPTYYASKYLHKILTPIMQRCPSYLKNSQDLIVQLENLYINTPVILVSADVKELYPSIPIRDGLRALYFTLTKLVNWDIKQVAFVCELAEFILINNIFTFNGMKYKQIFGTAMGTCFAVVYANIYLNVIEYEIWLQFKSFGYTLPILFKRYIDDIFAIFPIINNASAEPSHTLFLSLYNSLRTSIKLTWTTGDSVNFLDLTLSLGKRFNSSKQIDISLYQKEMNNYLYIPPTSFHTQESIKSFIVSEIRRYCLNCSDPEEFTNRKSLFLQRLLTRGYSKRFLKPLFNTQFIRSTLLSRIYTSSPTVFKRQNYHHQLSSKYKTLLALHISNYATLSQSLTNCWSIHIFIVSLMAANL